MFLCVCMSVYNCLCMYKPASGRDICLAKETLPSCAEPCWTQMEGKIVGERVMSLLEEVTNGFTIPVQHTPSLYLRPREISLVLSLKNWSNPEN